MTFEAWLYLFSAKFIEILPISKWGSLIICFF